MLLCQISDTHIKAGRRKAYGVVDTAAMLERCVRQILELPQRPDAVVATGDLVDGGGSDEYGLLRELLSPLTMPLYLIAGNHDQRDELRRAFADHRYLARQESFVQYAIDEHPLRLIALDLRFEGNREWAWQLRQRSDPELLAIAEFARQRGAIDRMIATSERTRDLFDFSQRFPAPHRTDLARHARAVGLDEAWVYGLIRQESRFIADARSSAGAQGLMQLMPATARYVARRVGMNDFASSRVNELDVNLRLGTSYLQMVFDDLDRQPLLASAAYNAGPARARAWRAALARPVEGAIFAETIPFNETRDYVQKVMSNAVVYAALFEGRAQSLKARLGTVVPRPAGTTELP